MNSNNVEEKQKRFEKVYSRYSALVIKMIFDMTTDFGMAEEVCQNVFMQYFIHMHKVVPGCEKQWLMLTTKRIVIDHYKKASTKYEQLLDEVWEEKFSELQTVDEDRLENSVKRIAQKELANAILQDLRHKNKSWYTIINGLYMEERSTEEIAKKLRISISMLYSKLYRAKLYIRKRYGEQYLEYLKSFEKE